MVVRRLIVFVIVGGSLLCENTLSWPQKQSLVQDHQNPLMHPSSSVMSAEKVHRPTENTCNTRKRTCAKIAT